MAGSRLYRNPSDANHWLQLALQGTFPNLDGIGARVEVHAEQRRQKRELHSGFGYGSQILQM